MSLNQEIDSIISSEGLVDSISATEEPIVSADPIEPIIPPTEVADPVVTPPSDPLEPVTPAEPVVDPTVEPPVVEQPTLTDRSPTETVQEAQTLIGNLNLTDDKIFNTDGTVKPFTEVVPAGAYFASQLNPVKVTDKDGKEHEFLLLSDVEKMFPNGFEAKNNIEQMKFERSILANETAFEAAVKTYEGAKAQYTQETNSIVQSRGENERIGKEYKAMADQGLVPKIDGDPNDPKFLESPAVKELNSILEFMDATNKDLSSKGLGQITSLYVAKQMMGMVQAKDDKNAAKDAIINQRNEVASLSATPAPSGDKPRQSYSDTPLSRLADEIISSEGLK